MNIREILDAIDNPIVLTLHAIITLFVVIHMNKMYKSTPKIEVVGWWFLGVGSFAVSIYEWYDVKGDWDHVIFAIGATILIVLNTQPDWRPWIANRRKNEAPVMPEDCDRRCEAFLKTRMRKHEVNHDHA